MSDGNVTGLTDDELAELTDEERDALNDEDTDEGDEFVDIREQFLDWVVEQFTIVEVTGSKDRVRWCDRWYDHPEVVARLYALWSARVQADQDENDLGAVSSWWINNWDRHAAVLFDPQTGPFRYCDRTRGHMADRKDTGPIVPLSIPSAEWQLPI